MRVAVDENWGLRCAVCSSVEGITQACIDRGSNYAFVEPC
jgi:hypothetical protein